MLQLCAAEEIDIINGLLYMMSLSFEIVFVGIKCLYLGCIIT
jgi:hypothetical protein